MKTQCVEVRAPARVNIIGEHTDYNGGFVLPMSTALFTGVSARRRNDQLLRISSNSIGESREFNLASIRRDDAVTWIEYVKGVASELQKFGVQLHGADLVIDSDIPLGAGLSSSASLELSVAKALLAIAGEEMPATELAKLCQRAEHNFAGVHCGIMDQFTLACAQKAHAILLDCRSLRTEQIALPKNAGFVLTDSGVRHSLADGEYNSRAEECAVAVAILASANPDIQQLRDLSANSLDANKTALGDLLYRRCRHVVTENERVHKAVRALAAADLPQLGGLLTECHNSLRDDFAVSCDELDALVAAANRSKSVFGARMVGAGFGGCVLSVCKIDEIEAAACEIRDNYAAVSGSEPWQHQVSAAGPVAVISDQ